MKSYGVTIEMKPLQQYFHMVITLVCIGFNIKSVSEILWCDHSNESSLSELLHNTVNFLGFYKYKKVISFVILLFSSPNKKSERV